MQIELTIDEMAEIRKCLSLAIDYSNLFNTSEKNKTLNTKLFEKFVELTNI